MWSRRQNRIAADRQHTIAGAVLGLFDLAFCVAVLTVGKHWLGLGVDALQTLTAVMLVFNGQAVFYVVREGRRMWSSYPSSVVITASVTDILIIPSLAFSGVRRRCLCR